MYYVKGYTDANHLFIHCRFNYQHWFYVKHTIIWDVKVFFKYNVCNLFKGQLRPIERYWKIFLTPSLISSLKLSMSRPKEEREIQKKLIVITYLMSFKRCIQKRRRDIDIFTYHVTTHTRLNAHEYKNHQRKETIWSIVYSKQNDGLLACYGERKFLPLLEGFSRQIHEVNEANLRYL